MSVSSAFSDRVKVLSASRTLLILSKTESSANEISSIKKIPPCLIAYVSGPSYHSNNDSHLPRANKY